MDKKRILIVEDDLGIQTLTKFCLEMDNRWSVRVANNGKEGLLKARELFPDVILLDLILPDLNGIEILDSLSGDRATSEIPIILFTARLIDKQIIEHKNSNIRGIIYKPYNSLTLSATIFNLLNKRAKLVAISHKL